MPLPMIASTVDLPIAIAIALVIPVVIAAAVGLPAWIAARMHGNYLKLRHDYLVAVGLPTGPAVPAPTTTGSFPRWMIAYYGYFVGTAILRLVHPSLGFTAHVLIFAAVAFFFFQKAYRSFAILQTHPGLESRLRWVPIIELVIWSLVGMGFVAVVHFLIVIGAPAEFGARG